LILDGETGYLVPPKNPAALAQRIGDVLCDDRLRAKMGEAGRQRVRDRFSLSLMVNGYQQLYDDCLAKK
jgi:glycosyltransferase involved in cell wall biosynthesis